MLATEILRSFFIHFFCKKTIRKKKKKERGKYLEMVDNK